MLAHDRAEDRVPLAGVEDLGVAGEDLLGVLGTREQHQRATARDDPHGEDVAVPCATCGGRTGAGSAAARRSAPRPASAGPGGSPVASMLGPGSPPNGRIRSKRRAVRSAVSGCSSVVMAAPFLPAILRVRRTGDRSAEQTLATRDRRGLGATGGVELAEDVGDVHRDGLGADEELAADLAVAAPLGDQGEDLGLARRQAGAWSGTVARTGAPPPGVRAADGRRARGRSRPRPRSAPGRRRRRRWRLSTSARWRRATASS